MYLGPDKEVVIHHVIKRCTLFTYYHTHTEKLMEVGVFHKKFDDAASLFREWRKTYTDEWQLKKNDISKLEHKQNTLVDLFFTWFW